MRARDEADTVQLSKIRIKEPLRAALEQAAEDRGVTMNAEIARRLEESFGRIESLFGGRAGLNLAVMLFANFAYAGGQQAAGQGHPEWMPAEWLRDPACFEAGLKSLVESVWKHHPKEGVTRKDYYDFINRKD